VYQKRYGLPFVVLMPYFETQPTARGSTMERGTKPYTFNYANLVGNKFKVALTICWEQIPWFTANSSTQEVICVSKKSFYTRNPNFFMIFVSSEMFGIILYFWLKK